ncbi:MAG TPA: 6-phosphogluconolactonase [Rhizomicrobium sp.]
MSAVAQFRVFADPDALARAAADWLLTAAQSSEGDFALCLAGGETPRRLYDCLGTPPYLGAFPWPRTHLFWGDERFVPPDDALSNLRMVRESLLARAPIPPGNVHPIPTAGLSPPDAAAAYERTLRDFRPAGSPLFDATLLGLGTDGHTASLFPHSPALAERERWVLPVVGAKPEPRITLTYPALESSRLVGFLVTGADKAPVLKRIRDGVSDDPAARLCAPGGAVWFADRAAMP